MLPYDPRWPEAYERAAAEVVAVLGQNLYAIHHIGSTSIPGIHAKPVIDILAVVGELDALDRRSAPMRALGYEVMGAFGIEGRRYFRRDDANGKRTHQVHAFAHKSPHVLRHLAFRDYLCVHTDIAEAYSELKQRLAATHPHDMEAYMAG